MKLARILISTFAIFGCGAIGHSFGSGVVSYQNGLYLFFVSVLALSGLALKQTLHGPKLALIITLAQVVTHIFFAETGRSDIRMAFAHIVSGVITYQLISRLDSILSDLLQFFSSIFIPKFTNFSAVKFELSLNTFEYQQPFNIKHFLYTVTLRAPPAVLAN